MTGNISAKADKAAAKKPKKVSKYSKRKVDPAFYWMTIPAMILVCIFLYLPFLQGAMYSFTNSQGYGDYKFIGFKNYIAMFQDARVGHAYLFTIFIAILITLGTNILGMFLAVLLNSKIAFKNGFRAIFFIPYTLSVLVIGYVFKYIFMTPLPALGQALHIDWLSTSMISNPDLAWFPIVFLSIWQGVAYSTLLYLAGLQTIDNEIYEAASIDGVNAWRIFWKIIFPLMGPINATIAILTALWAWNDFLLPLITLTDQSNQTIPLAQYVFQSQFTSNYPMAFASYLMAMAPVLIVYIFAQKWVVGGVMRGAVK